MVSQTIVSASAAVTTPLRGAVVLQVVHSLEKGAF
jgi:hypothetical protein